DRRPFHTKVATRPTKRLDLQRESSRRSDPLRLDSAASRRQAAWPFRERRDQTLLLGEAETTAGSPMVGLSAAPYLRPECATRRQSVWLSSGYSRVSSKSVYLAASTAART